MGLKNCNKIVEGKQLLRHLLVLFIGLFQKKSKQGRLRIYFLENPPGIFHFLTLSLEIPDKTKLNPLIFHTIVLASIPVVRNPTIPKTETPGNSTFFLGHRGNSTLFLINPWKFHMLFP